MTFPPQSQKAHLILLSHIGRCNIYWDSWLGGHIVRCDEGNACPCKSCGPKFMWTLQVHVDKVTLPHHTYLFVVNYCRRVVVSLDIHAIVCDLMMLHGILYV